MAKGNIIVENVVFILLNFVFFSILLFFLMQQGGGDILKEEVYSKQIALLVDSAKPGMNLKFNIEELRIIAEENGVALDNIVQISGNHIVVRISEKGGYSYSFFNDVSIDKSYSYFKNSKDGDELYVNLRIKEND